MFTDELHSSWNTFLQSGEAQRQREGGGRQGGLFVYVYDSTYAAAAAKALSAPTTHARLAQSAGVVWSMLRCIACPDDFHVHSHQGHPWNEMVDVVASRASKGLLHVPCPAAGPRILNDIVKSPWVFINVLPRVLRDQYPACGGLIPAPCVGMQACELAEAIDRPLCNSSDPGSLQPVPLVVCSYNALSLCAKAKRVQLAGALRLKRCHIAGVQEGRRRVEATRVENGFLQVAASADNGNYGCQIWFSTEIAFASSRGRCPGWG